MATGGFPWQAESHVREPTYLDEKASQPAPPLPTQTENLRDVPNAIQHSPPNAIKRSRGEVPKAQSSVKGSLKQKTLTNYWAQKDPPTQPPVRTLPPWIRDAEEGDLDDLDTSYLDSPDVAFLAQHNHSPSLPRRPGFAGSHSDLRTHPTSSGDWRPERTSRWISFARPSAYPSENYQSEKVDKEWLDKNFTDYSQPWLANHDENDEEDGLSRYRAFRKKRQAWYKRIQFTILRNPFIPLAFRLTVFTFALVAIGLGVSIYRETGKIDRCLHQPEGARDDFCLRLVGDGRISYYRDPSALMAIVVDVISVVYTSYITYDEYFSKPLGLRPARAKIRLVLLDLFFIVFQAANLSLSFESLTVDEGACAVGDGPETFVRFDSVCDRQTALSGVLLVSLVAWLSTFSVSVLRLVERIA